MRLCHLVILGICAGSISLLSAGCGGSDSASDEQLANMENRLATSEAALADEQAARAQTTVQASDDADVRADVKKLQQQLIDAERRRETEAVTAGEDAKRSGDQASLEDKIAELELKLIESERKRATEMAAAQSSAGAAQGALATANYAEGLEDRIGASDNLPLDNKLELASFAASTNESMAAYVGDQTTVSRWCWRSATGDVVGAWEQIGLKKKGTITGIRVWQGLGEDIAKLDYWARIKDATLLFGDGSTQKISLTDDKGWQYFKLKPVNTDSVRIFAETVFDSEVQQVSLCEVHVYGRGQ